MIWLLIKMSLGVIITYYIFCLCWPIIVLACMVSIIKGFSYACQAPRCDCDARVADPSCSCKDTTPR